MIRMKIDLSENQIKGLDKLAQQYNVSRSEIVRRVVDKELAAWDASCNADAVETAPSGSTGTSP